MRCRPALVALAAASSLLIHPPDAAVRAVAAPVVVLQIRDAFDQQITTTAVDEGTLIHLTGVVSGTAPDRGLLSFRRFVTPDCSGSSADELDVPTLPSTVTVPQSIDIANSAGWDSATTWVSPSGDEFDTNWGGSLFMGTDPVIFYHSGAGWRFTGVPLQPDDVVDHAYLSLRIRKSRPNLASETFGTWKTLLMVDADDGSDFQGATRPLFLARFDGPAVSWGIPFSYSDTDPFGTADGAFYARSPDIASLVRMRIADPSWQYGAPVAVGILDDFSIAIAEAQVVDLPDYARLHLDWTTVVPVQQADSEPLALAAGQYSFRARYVNAGDTPVDSPCRPLLVTPPDSDRDGYPDARETSLGKDPFTYCATMRADVTMDGQVNLLDLGAVAAHYGQTIPPAPARLDQNDDNKTNLPDLGAQAAKYGRSVTECP